MALVAKLYEDVRLAERYPVTLDGTLRDTNAVPQDVVIDDLSATGFRIASAAGLSVDDVITLGIFGVGLRSAQVLRESGGRYGCQFLTSLTHDELLFALRGLTPPTPIPIPVSQTSGVKIGAQASTATDEKLSYTLRLASFATVAVVPWVALALLARLL